MRIYPIPLLFVFIFLCSYVTASAQEENAQLVTSGRKYVSLKIKGLDKYNDHLAQQQKHLLNKLKRKEKHFAHKLEYSDSAAYARYKDQNVSYDSIAKLSQEDTGVNAAKIAKKNNSSIDSLKKIEAFISAKSGGQPNLPGQSAELNKLQGELNYKAYITEQITKHTNFLKTLAAGSGGKIPGFTAIEKQVFYGKSKMKVYKEMDDDPTVAEDKAMEYLQGTDGFDKAMSNDGAAGSMQSLGGNADASQLEKMGYQTKGQMQKNLQGKFGGNLGNVAKQVNGTIKDFQNKQKDITGSIKDSKQSVAKLKNTDKPSFKVNPMRGLPFMKRIEKQYNWQATRATADGKQPALMNLSAMAGFKYTPKLTYGVGIATSIGMGQSWQNIHFSFQGIGYRTFATWEWQYGIGAYAGYERMYKQAAFIKQKDQPPIDVPTPHSTGNYTESLLVGLTKKYNINTKYKGAIQVLYDIWWQQKGLPNPIVLRFVTIKK